MLPMQVINSLHNFVTTIKFVCLNQYIQLIILQV